jgi:hypothetical protein
MGVVVHAQSIECPVEIRDRDKFSQALKFLKGGLSDLQALDRLSYYSQGHVDCNESTLNRIANKKTGKFHTLKTPEMAAIFILSMVCIGLELNNPRDQVYKYGEQLAQNILGPSFTQLLFGVHNLGSRFQQFRDNATLISFLTDCIEHWTSQL